MSERKVLFATCAGHAQAEKAIAELQRLDFDMKNISVFGKAHLSDDDVVGCYTAGGRLSGHGYSAAFWERLWNLLGDGGFFVVPGIGAVVFAGEFVRTFVSAIEEGVSIAGVTALGMAIHKLGIPQDCAFQSEFEIRSNRCALVVSGFPEALATARSVLERAGASEIIAAERAAGLERLPPPVGS